VQLWCCTTCKRTYTPGQAALHNKTYPLRMILSPITDYKPGYTLEETTTRSHPTVSCDPAARASDASVRSKVGVRNELLNNFVGLNEQRQWNCEARLPTA